MSENNLMENEATERLEIYGSFFLSNSEFALSVTNVQEVVRSPQSYTPVPLAPSYLKGLFNLRGMIIPVIDLRDLLSFQRASTQDSQKIAIIEYNQICIGLLFDETGEVFKNTQNERSDFEDNRSMSVVCGVFKKEHGKRIIQILDVIKLFELQNIPKDTSQNMVRRMGLNKSRGTKKQCISFTVGPARCALPISVIQEIIKVDRVNESALGFGDCLGTIDLRGSTVPVIDFPAFLKYREVDRSDTATSGDRRIFVMRIENELFGLIVDSVDSIVSFFQDELISFPSIGEKRSGLFQGCITGHGDYDILLLDHLKILTDQEINEITKGHSKIYQSNLDEKNKKKSTHRQTFVTFKMGHSYAISINEIKEIIDYPTQLLRPPGLKQYVHGILNLRGELVTILDAHSIYLSDNSTSDKGPKKVLIIKREDLYFGLTVDSVDSILTVSHEDKIKLPKILYGFIDKSDGSETMEAIEISSDEGKRNVLILSVGSLTDKIRIFLAA